MLAISVGFSFGVFDAGGTDDPRRGEWPPEPGRLFCALVANDPDPTGWACLEWLEQQALPEVHVHDDEPAVDNHDLYVITNTSKAGSPLRPGREAKERSKAAVYPAVPEVTFVWPDARPDTATLATLDRLARGVPYLGRSTSPVIVRVASDQRPATDGATIFEPAELASFERSLAAPYPGYAARLREAHEAGRRAWEVRRSFPYRRRINAAPVKVARVTPSPWSLLVLDADLPRRLHTSQTTAVTKLLRDAVMARFPDPVPGWLSGHEADDRHHVGFLAFPNVGSPSALPGAEGSLKFKPSNEHADGRLLGLAIAVPSDLEADGVRSLLHAVDDEWQLRASGNLFPRDSNHTISVKRANAAPATSGASRERWSRPSRWWATATPVVLDRWPAGQPAEELVADALVTAGFPRPVRVVAQRAPMLPGAVTMSPSAVMRRAGARTRPYTHAWAEFDVEVAGPVIAGSMRYLGVGLFAPLFAAGNRNVGEP